MNNDFLQRLVSVRHNKERLEKLSGEDRETFLRLDHAHRDVLTELNQKKASYNCTAQRIRLLMLDGGDITELSHQAHLLQAEIDSMNARLNSLTDALIPYLDRCLSDS